MVRLQRALKPYENHWNDWLQSNACFLSGMDERIIGYLFAFKGDVFCAARVLELSEIDYLFQLRKLIEKLEGSQIEYLAWLEKATGQLSSGVNHKKN